MAAEHDATTFAWIVDKIWALVTVAVAALVGWVMRHEARVTRLEAQYEEAQHTRERTEAKLDRLDAQVEQIASKLDRLLGHCLNNGCGNEAGRHRGNVS